MKVILKKAVLKLGNPGQIIEAKPGYVFNFLVPQGLGMPVNKENLMEFETKKSKILEEHESLKRSALGIQEVISGKPVFLERSVNEAGNFYSSLNPEEVVNALKSTFTDQNLSISKVNISYAGNIRSFGIYDLNVTLYNGVTAPLKLVIARSVAAGEEMFAKGGVSPVREEIAGKPESKDDNLNESVSAGMQNISSGNKDEFIPAEEDVYNDSNSEVEEAGLSNATEN